MRRYVFCIAAIFAGATSAAAGGPSWTGPYIGIDAGYTWGSASVTDDINDGVPPGPFSYNASGFIGGGVAGYNLQLAQFVIGFEGNLGYMDLSGAGIIPSSNPAAHQDITLDGGLYALATGRAGFLIMPTTLVYAKGGFAYFDTDARQKTTNPGYVTNGTGAYTGYVIGGGIEHMLTSNLSIKIEYQHFDFGTKSGDQTSVTDPPIGHVYNNWTDVRADSVKVGTNLRF